MTPLQQAAAPSTQKRHTTRGDRHRDKPPSEAQAALDRVLRLFERHQHTAIEMRVLIRLLERRDASMAELAGQLGIPPSEITRACRRLAMRGLVRTHHAGQPEQMLMQITRSGRATVRPLLVATGSEAARPSREDGPVR